VKEPLIPVEEALRRVLVSGREPLGEEWVALPYAVGRTLARDLAALRTQPPFANSAMDGYALRSKDAASPGATLKLVGESAAGRAFSGTLHVGETARIFTGAPLPEGADAVAIQEDAAREGDQVTLQAAVTAGDHVRYAGIDFKDGEALLSAGTRLSPRDVALAAAANHARLLCYRKPRVAVLATGDELVSPGEPIGPAQIVASNNLFVVGLTEAAGGEAIDLGIARDDPTSLAAAIRRSMDEKADVLVTLGGASVGDYDLVQKALVDAGMELGFWKIAMRPGKPLMHGRVGAMRVLGLPGNPTSSAVCSLLFLTPLLRALQGDLRAGADNTEPARLGAAMAKNGPRQDYARASLTRGEDGGWIAHPLPDQDSSLVKTLARADALVIRAIGAPPAATGDPCRILRFAALGG
jgi:molybdopterin molybdotransferase